VSAPAESRRESIDTVVGLMSAAAIFLALLAATDLNMSINGTHLEMRPVRIGVAAILLSLIAAGIGGRNRRLAAVAVAIAGLGWLVGMIVGVVTERPLF
jgi:hypothetical protein